MQKLNQILVISVIVILSVNIANDSSVTDFKSRDFIINLSKCKRLKVDHWSHLNRGFYPINLKKRWASRWTHGVIQRLGVPLLMSVAIFMPLDRLRSTKTSSINGRDLKTFRKSVGTAQTVYLSHLPLEMVKFMGHRNPTAGKLGSLVPLAITSRSISALTQTRENLSLIIH